MESFCWGYLQYYMIMKPLLTAYGHLEPYLLLILVALWLPTNDIH